MPTLLQQLTPFTCGLACIESLTTDLGCRITEAEILRRYKNELLSKLPQIEQFGATTPEDHQLILSKQGLKSDLLHLITKKELHALFSSNVNCIVTSVITPAEIHTFRVLSFDGSNSVKLMDPGFFNNGVTIAECTLDQLLAWDSRFLFVEQISQAPQE
ncbi:MAG: hypothetical protein JNN17_23040 [Verrucomicrobiaceae bacterium]|nr:hypothetical protein [Verrucomicrobiaceae bacterium]